MSVNPKLSKEKFCREVEIMNTKLRMELSSIYKHNEAVEAGMESLSWAEMEDSEKVRKAEEEASLRQILDPLEKSINFSKKRVTDSSVNKYSTLPKELKRDEEVYLDLRRNRFKKVYGREKEENGDVPNLSKTENIGLNSLIERTADKELIVAKTDKSGKIIPCSVEAYVSMGEVHTSKDKEIEISEMDEMARLVSCHTSSWLKMLNVGEQHGQANRFRKSFLGENSPAPMYILIKDHKETKDGEFPKTRPVVAGCSSYNVGLSEILSELLEGVYKTKEDKVGVISSDDFLANLHQFNKKISDEGLQIYDPENVAHVSGEVPTISMIASDVVALFPSMKVKTTARICAEMIVQSETDFQELDLQEMLLYIRMNQDMVSDLRQVQPYLPQRRKKGGKCAPGMTNTQIEGPHHSHPSRWSNVVQGKSG